MFTVLKSEFNTDLPERLREKEVKMCNYSDFVWNRGQREGIKKGKAEALVNLIYLLIILSIKQLSSVSSCDLSLGRVSELTPLGK